MWLCFDSPTEAGYKYAIDWLCYENVNGMFAESIDFCIIELASVSNKVPLFVPRV